MSINTYQFGDFTVQSYFDEMTTRRLFDYALSNKLLGRISPPRKAFLGMAQKLLWEKRFTFEEQRYLISGGGKQLAIYLDEPEPEESGEDDAGRACIVCLTHHPPEDLTDTEDGPMCLPCFAVRFPPCAVCGERLRLPDGVDPDNGPFTCDRCAAGKTR